ncbi:multicopper oxidase family protein [Blastochloris sulfoviridis]|uniref:Multicopper oxidase family protein n=1 Tax=Blastochloris sulfoviridis TaxID=50712 RepID=A0A5M6HSX4_9HYPH|nr:multicopper oxidase family protein [Blastochloris sulfoviridis]KAA5598946.1 multicopper oxidase family protein [Blastochloris sulfoviridis]
MTAFRPTRRTVLGGTVVTIAALGPSRPLRAETGGEPPPGEARRLALKPGAALLRGPDLPPSPVWGFDGQAPGPILRVRRGGEVWVRAENGLDQPTAIHWHGIRLTNPMDGVPPLTQAAIPPGGAFDYRFACPDAGTFWYHAFAGTPEQLGRGLAGALIVEEETPIAVDQDIVLLLQDWRLDDGSAADPAPGAVKDDEAKDGEAKNAQAKEAEAKEADARHATVNGRPAADIAVKGHDRIRLRLINAAAWRIAALAFEGGLRPVLVAVDGQPSEAFELGRPRVALPPGGRVDLIVDMPPAVADPAASPPAIRLHGYGTDSVLATFRVDPGPPRRPEPPGAVAPLPDNPLPRHIELKGAHRLDLAMDGGSQPPAAGSPWTFRGGDGPAGPPLFRVARGRTVVLALVNKTPLPHAVHIHGHHVRLLDSLDDGWKPWWHDTLLVPEAKTARIAFIADNPGKWLLPCRAVEQPADGTGSAMAAWFEVT